MTSNYNHLYVHRRYPINVGDVFTIPIFYEHKSRIRRFSGLKVISVHYEYGWKVLTFDHNEWPNNNPTIKYSPEECNNERIKSNIVW